MEHTPKIAAFLEQVNSGKMQKDLHRIYKAIKEDNIGWTLSMVENWMSFKRSTAAGRLSDLTDMGVIWQLDGKYFLTPECDIESYATRREYQRYNRWRKLGEEKGWFKKISIEESFPSEEEIIEEADGRYPVNRHSNPDDSPYVGTQKTFIHGVRWALEFVKDNCRQYI